jgi:hypothetical protein
MGIRKALLPFIPSPILRQYRKIKRHFVAKKRIFGKTGNNIAGVKRILLNKILIKEKQVDAVKIVQYLSWENPFNTNDFGKYQFLEKEYKLENNDEIDVEFNNYGSWTLEIQYFNGNRVVAKEKKGIYVDAQEYNIVYLSATLPVEIFLINLWDITSARRPTIVGLERLLFDYKALPENVFPFPLATEEELNTANTGFFRYAQRMVSYIGNLYKMNPEAKIHLYLCDHQAYFSLAFLYANKIPEKNFTIHILSDGTGSYEAFNYIFGNSDAERTYNAMKATWKLSKQEAGRTGVQKWRKETFIKCGNPSVSQTRDSDDQMEELSNRLAYAYVMTRENTNFEWILHNPGLLDVGDRTHFPLVESIKKIDFVAGIKSLDKHREELIKLLGIDFDVFEKSYSVRKKICMLLRSYPPSDSDIQYVNATIESFGNDYDYYFKEHPRTVVSPERKKAIKDMDIEFLNPKLPTELYMMINPDIYLAGYLSSAFLSVGLLRNPAEQILSVWDEESPKIKTSCLDFTAKTAMNIVNNKVIVLTTQNPKGE